MIPAKSSLLFLAFALALAAFPGPSVAQKFNVFISNYLEGDDSIPVTVHCRSPFMDVPSRVIQWSEPYTWEVEPRPPAVNMRFLCDISSSNGKRGQFLMFDMDRDKSRCPGGDVCYWRIYDDGIYLRRGFINGNYQKQFSW